jgi:osmotically-inducible protein OsmY
MAAEALAKSTVGVVAVRNYLGIQPRERVNDWVLARRIRNALVYDPYTESLEIDVDVENGKVTLTGEVETAFERAQATDIVGRISGVVDLDNRIATDGKGYFAYDAYLCPYDPYFDSWTYVPSSTAGSDREIARGIEAELRWSPFVDADEVHVSVENGEATLTGSVDTLAERAAATHNAFQGGAVSVRNHLKLEPIGE